MPKEQKKKGRKKNKGRRREDLFRREKKTIYVSRGMRIKR
jgi:hypothetical protein